MFIGGAEGQLTIHVVAVDRHDMSANGPEGLPAYGHDVPGRLHKKHLVARRIKLR